MPKESTTKSTNEEKPKLKPCCVCLDTKRVRDEWYVIFQNDLKLILKRKKF